MVLSDESDDGSKPRGNFGPFKRKFVLVGVGYPVYSRKWVLVGPPFSEEDEEDEEDEPIEANENEHESEDEDEDSDDSFVKELYEAQYGPGAPGRSEFIKASKGSSLTKRLRVTDPVESTKSPVKVPLASVSTSPKKASTSEFFQKDGDNCAQPPSSPKN
ncbi:uncharacterized protein [Spinacia oleracea]|uniref:Uncharacterized protein n=1 Tax=Spinacia oleracea TaxID=3562 RepID=A0A9R0K8F4_SPIOL|nr:uncharacterized protein LOC110800260 [Spinacia oleracea]XP_021861256.2 uncharacterized protein LOC110800260 [Spinacia oleracea]XP_021861257.2 uncharacterized protein LOC110800260 [Spinacia oleracea]XP_056692554.1 uncharacterized protein LOC110800260 [Spinacia oleracea]XP_056696298.1 uncharacterized protein LOC130470341 [Spinacia oleracea]XP_056696299.1 uncharacterized protein LOC130470341 [Spinacia oleracea]XP_056696300.1 uncharacterized protein LOC130470341 [Spinacia oleracea]XP_05669630